MSSAHFRVEGRMNGASSATVTINRTAGTITIRPHRRRRAYTLPLAEVAEMVLWRIVRGEAFARLAERRRKRRERKAAGR